MKTEINLQKFFKRIYLAIIPENLELRNRRFELLIWSFALSLSVTSEYFGFLAWFSLVRPIYIIANLKKEEVFGSCYFFSFFFNVFSVYWIAMVTPVGMVGAVLLISIYYAITLFLFQRIYNYKQLLGSVILPFLWVGMEYFRTVSEFAFPWSDLGLSQSYYNYVLQIVSVISVHGLSLLIVGVNVLLFQLYRNISVEKKLTSVLASVATILFLIAYGWIVVPVLPQEGTYTLALLQGSIPIEEKWKPGNQSYSYNLYDSLANSVDKTDSVKLFIWPETSAPAYLSHQPYDRKIVGEIASSTNSYHLVGGLGAKVEGDKKWHYNSCYQFNPNGQLEKRHDKVKLVPFAEHVPYQDKFPFLKKEVLEKYLTFIKTYDVQWWSNFYPGDSLVLFELPDAGYSVMICFEITFPEYVRSAILNGAEFMVGITNDTWFGNSAGTHMHSRSFIAKMVENRCWGARVANSGLTYIVDDYGIIRDELKQNEVKALVGKVRRIDSFSTFTKYGDLAGKFSLLITYLTIAIFLILWLFRKIKKFR